MEDEEGPKPYLNYKPVFQKFIEANSALLDCYAAIGKDNMSGMSIAQLDTHCSGERERIRSILSNNEMTMTQVVKDRVAVLNAINERHPGPIMVSSKVTVVDQLPKFRD